MYTASCLPSGEGKKNRDRQGIVLGTLPVTPIGWVRYLNREVERAPQLAVGPRHVGRALVGCRLKSCLPFIPESSCEPSWLFSEIAKRFLDARKVNQQDRPGHNAGSSLVALFYHRVPPRARLRLPLGQPGDFPRVLGGVHFSLGANSGKVRQNQFQEPQCTSQGLFWWQVWAVCPKVEMHPLGWCRLSTRLPETRSRTLDRSFPAVTMLWLLEPGSGPVEILSGGSGCRAPGMLRTRPASFHHWAVARKSRTVLIIHLHSSQE